MGALGRDGLLRDVGHAVYRMHPALTGWLRVTMLSEADKGSREQWTRAFVEVMGSLADNLVFVNKLSLQVFSRQDTVVPLPVEFVRYKVD